MKLPKTADCKVCGTEFLKGRGSRSYCGNNCKDFARSQRSKDDALAKRLKRFYGMTVDEYYSLLAQYNDRCSICGSTEKLHIDHDHSTNEVRGILCHSCNIGLGFFKDSLQTLVGAINYLSGGRDFDRLEWDTYFLNLARVASLRGDCIRRKVGAVLTDQDHIIRGLGYNGSEPGGLSCLNGDCDRCNDLTIPSGSNYDNCIERHAEDNCLRNSNAWLSDPYNKEMYTIYITCEPCNNCRDLLYSNGIYRVVWPDGEYVNGYRWI